MKCLKQVFALAALAALSCSNMELYAYGRYAAAWYNEKTKSMQKVMGDVHGIYLPGGEALDLQSYNAIKEACESVKVKPFWVSETHHAFNDKLRMKMELDSEKFGIMESLTFAHQWKKSVYKENVLTLKKQPNLFSSKDFVMPRFDFFQTMSSHVGDLRSDVLGVLYAMISASQSAFGVLQEVLSKKPLSEEDEKFIKELRSNPVTQRDYGSAQYMFLDTSMIASLCKYFKIDFLEYKKTFLKSFQMQLKSHNVSVASLTKVVLEKAGNQLLVCEKIARRTNNYAMFTILKDLYKTLEKNLLMVNNSAMARFMDGSYDISEDIIHGIGFNDIEQELNTIMINEVAQSVDLFMKTVMWDLADFGFFAKMIQMMPFTHNMVLYAGDGHVNGVETLLEKAGYKRVWVHQNDMNTPLSKEDCEKFFSFKPEQKGDSKTEDVILKSKL